MVRGETLGELRELYEAKAAAELDAADELLPALPVRRSGDVLGRVLLVKGEAGEADLESGYALAGGDGDASKAALAALGVAVDPLLAVVTRPAHETPPDAAERRLVRYLEAVDPSLVVALDETAASDLAAAAGIAYLPFGEPVRQRGRALLAVDGLEASLADEERKRRVWRQFRSLGNEQRHR